MMGKAKSRTGLCSRGTNLRLSSPVNDMSENVLGSRLAFAFICVRVHLLSGLSEVTKAIKYNADPACLHAQCTVAGTAQEVGGGAHGGDRSSRREKPLSK